MSSSIPESRTLYPLPGPGLLIAVSSSGWVGLLSLISFGADSGFACIGITIVTLIFKYALITGLGRYTLATGMDIFAGLATVPGPKNWAIWMINGILYLEIFMLGFSAMTMVRLMNELSGYEFPPLVIIFLIFSLLYFLVSLDSYRIFRTILIRAIIFILLGFSSLILSLNLPFHEITTGIIPNLYSYAGVYEASVIISSVGSGFSLLFYSPWLINHMRKRVTDEKKPEIYRRIRVDAGMGLSFLLLMSVLFYSMGFFFLYEHGLGAPEPDLTLGIVFMVMNLGQYQNMIFAFVCITTLFCSLFGGLYGRARVLEVTLPRTVPGFQMTRKKFLLIVLILVLSSISSDLFLTQELLKEFLSIKLILFGVLTGLLIFVDLQLSKKDRGSKIWYGIMIAGVLMSLGIGSNLVMRYFF